MGQNGGPGVGEMWLVDKRSEQGNNQGCVYDDKNL